MSCEVKSSYIHIPFCDEICSYCDFCKMFYNESLVSLYLDALEKEIKSNYKGEILDTIYIGGGTPSCLNINQLEKLFDIVKIFNKNINIEFTIECNFESIDRKKLELFYNNGVNRLSFGVETINKKFFKILNRYSNKKNIKEIISIAKDIGFTNINLDLMYALPDQGINDLLEDLDFIFSLDVNHISCYSLMIEEHTKLYIDKIKNVSDDLDFYMYEVICKEMNKHGYIHYEISNFSKDGYFSKHNLCYWNNLEYYGFGLGASSYIGKERINNTRSLNKYLKGNYILNIENLLLNDIIYYEIILNLRKKEGIFLEDFQDKYGFSLDEKYDYSELILQGLLKKEENYLFIPSNKWYISNEIIVRLLEGEKYE